MDIRPTLQAHRGVLRFLFGFALLRPAVADCNPIPSGSMRPTLLESDVVTLSSPVDGIRLQAAAPPPPRNT